MTTDMEYLTELLAQDVEEYPDVIRTVTEQLVNYLLNHWQDGVAAGHALDDIVVEDIDEVCDILQRRKRELLARHSLTLL